MPSGKMVDLLIGQNRLKSEHRDAVYKGARGPREGRVDRMENGVAIPHASVDGVEDALAALAISPAGNPLPVDGRQPAKIIILLVIPRKWSRSTSGRWRGSPRLLDKYEEMRDALTSARSRARRSGDRRRGAEKTLA